MVHKLTIPGALPGLNDYISAERRHRQRAAAMKRDCEQLVILAIKPQLRGVRFPGPVFMAYTWFEPNRRRDKDNISAFGRKVIQDAIVKMGVIPNDGWANIDGFSDTFRVDKQRPRIEVTIREVAP